MPTVDQVFAWLTALPPGSLYAAAVALAFIENVFPPFPSDLFIGICAFVAGPGEASLAIVYGAVVIGNVAGAASTYALGRRYGAKGLHAQMERRGWLREEQKLEAMYGRYGLLGLFVGRMIPGVRGVVPMVAGALQLSAARVLGVVTVAAAIWYGVLTWLAYHVGRDWDSYADDIAALGKWGTIIGVSIALIATMAVVFFIRSRRRNP